MVMATGGKISQRVITEKMSEQLCDPITRMRGVAIVLSVEES